MPHGEEILGLEGHEIKDIRRLGGSVLIEARCRGPVSCPHCGCGRLRP